MLPNPALAHDVSAGARAWVVAGRASELAPTRDRPWDYWRIGPRCSAAEWAVLKAPIREGTRSSTPSPSETCATNGRLPVSEAQPPTRTEPTQQELESRLWAAANSLRGPVDAADFKDRK
jgi:hypothetical protein